MQKVLVSPSNYDLANAIENNVVGATPFTRRDVRIANIIYGHVVAGMKGKTTKKPSKVPNPDEVRDVPQYIVKNYSRVSLCIDVMHVNGIIFLVVVSKHIGLVQCVCIRKKNREKFLHAILLVIREYHSRGIFDVVSVGADKAVDAIESEIKDEPYNVTLTTCDADHHVKFVERMKRFVKEQIRTVRVTMPYKTIHKRMTIEMVHRVIILKNSISWKGILHSILSPRELVTGKKSRCPTIRIGQYIQGLVGSTNSTDQERSIDALYLGRVENGSGHIVFKLDTKAVVSVNRVVLIPTPSTIIDRVNEMGHSEKKPKGVQFTNKDGRVSINNLNLNLYDDNNNDRNASDESFDHDKENQEELDKEEKTRFYDLAKDEVQEDHFQLPFQQHQAAALLLDKLSKIRSAKVRSVKEKKKKEVQQKPDDDGDDDGDGDDNYNDVNDNTSKSAVNDDNDESNETDGSNETDERVNLFSNELNSIIEDTENLDGQYWANGTLGSKTDLYMLSAITTYNNIDGLHGLRSTSQYGFNRGMKEFGQVGYDATVSELSNNPIGMDAVAMLDKSRIISDVFMNELSYLMFLKRKRTDIEKATGCADG